MKIRDLQHALQCVGRVIVARRNVWPIIEGLDVRDSRVHQLNVPMLVRAPAPC